MDPNETLERIRQIVADIHRGGYPIPGHEHRGLMHDFTKGELAELGEELAELTDGLDKWMSKGGFLPDEWLHAQFKT